MSDIEERLKEIKIEDFIWIIYIGIILLSYYSNYLEEKYFINNDINSKNKYRSIIIIIFSILLLVYLYFLKDSYDSLKSLNDNSDNKTIILTYLSFIASLLIAIAGIIYLYIAINDENINIELAFN
ncbi:MAG: hypothetical protein E7159_00790 [Firmicutes bacterium]|nr:hypothetical protein [Bacillota bacterium]